MRLLKNSIMMPLQGSMDSFAGGLFDADGQFVADSLLHRGRPCEPCTPSETLQGTYIYGGCLFGHFGHFIWESLSRLYVVRKCKPYPIVFSSPNDTEKIFLEAFHALYKTLGAKNGIQLVARPTRIENLIYDSPGSSLSPLFITDAQLTALMHCDFRDMEPVHEKVWLSRAMLNFGKLTNEREIEKAIRALGFTILYPEKLTFLEQIRIVSTAKIVAGCDGSAFFSVLFAKHVAGKFLVFNRRRHIPGTIPFVFKKRAIPFELHTLELEAVQEEWPVALFHQPHPEKIIDILKQAMP